MLWSRLVLSLSGVITSGISFLAYTLLLRDAGASKYVDRVFYASSIPYAVAGLSSGVALYILPSLLAKVKIDLQESITKSLLYFTTLMLIFVIIFLIGFSPSEKHEISLNISFAIIACSYITSAITVSLCQARGQFKQSIIPSFINSIGLLLGVCIAICYNNPLMIVIGQLALSFISAYWTTRHISASSLLLNMRDIRATIISLSPLMHNLVYICIGTLSFTLILPIDAILSTKLDIGTLSILSYAQRINVAFATAISLGSHSIAASTSIKSLNSGGVNALKKFANKEICKIMLASIIVWVAFYFLGNWALGILMYSSSMSHQHIETLYDCSLLMLIAAGPMAAVPYIYRVFYALNEYKKPAFMGLVVAPCYYILTDYMIPYFGILAFVYSIMIVWWITFTTTYIWLNKIKNI